MDLLVQDANDHWRLDLVHFTVDLVMPQARSRIFEPSFAAISRFTISHLLIVSCANAPQVALVALASMLLQHGGDHCAPTSSCPAASPGSMLVYSVRRA